MLNLFVQIILTIVLSVIFLSFLLIAILGTISNVGECKEYQAYFWMTISLILGICLMLAFPGILTVLLYLVWTYPIIN